MMGRFRDTFNGHYRHRKGGAFRCHAKPEVAAPMLTPGSATVVKTVYVPRDVIRNVEVPNPVNLYAVGAAVVGWAAFLAKIAGVL